MSAQTVPLGDLIAASARSSPDRTAIRIIERPGSAVSSRSFVSYGTLDYLAKAWARSLQSKGVDADTAVGIAIPPSIAFAAATLGAMHLGATVFGLSSDDATAKATRRAVSGKLVLVTQNDADAHRPADHAEPTDRPAHPRPRTASLTGGTTTGEPRLVLRPNPWTYDPTERLSLDDHGVGRRLGQVQLVALPLHHSGFTSLIGGLSLDHEVLIMPRFEARLFVDAVTAYRVNFMRLVPTIMAAVAALPEFERLEFSSVESVCHGSAMCAHDVKLAWIGLVGADRITEGYASAERLGAVFIRGDEWLTHRGSVGRPLRVGDDPRPPTNAVVRVVDETTGLDCAPGEVGTIYMNRLGGGTPTFLSPGSLDERGGLFSVGDRGHIDGDGYLYLAGRSTEWINVGGSSVNLGRVEQVVATIPGVREAEAYGMQDRVFGTTVGLLLVTAGGSDEELTEIKGRCRELLTDHERPVRYTVVSSLDHSSTGKLKRSIA